MRIIADSVRFPAFRLLCFLLLFPFSAPAQEKGSPIQADDIPDTYVRRVGTDLMLGDKSFTFAGANQYYLFYKSRAMVDEVLEDAARMGLTVIRTWAFCDGSWYEGQSLQPNARNYHEDTFRKLDYIVYKANQLGLKVVFSFVNNWDNFGGMNTYVRWSADARNHDDFYTDAATRSIFRDYLNYILYRTNWFTGIRYKDDPTIMMWELANEPRIDPRRRQDLYNWIDEMARYIKNIDSYHLVSTGSEGDIATDFVATHASPAIDLASFHLYPDHWNMSEAEGLDYVRRHIQMARQKLGKPVYVGEFGVKNRGQRDRIFGNWFQLFSAERIAGSLVWVLSGHQDDGSLYPDYDGYTIYYPESETTSSLLENFARSFIRRLTPDL